MEVDLKALDLGLRVVSVILVPVIGYILYQFRELVKEVRGNSDKFEQLEHRMVCVEKDVDGLPTREDLHQISKDITKLYGVVDGVGKDVAWVKQILVRHEDFLLKENGNGK